GVLHRREPGVLPDALPGPAGHAAPLSGLYASLPALERGGDARLRDHGVLVADRLRHADLRLYDRLEASGQLLGRRGDHARMDAVESPAVPPVRYPAGDRGQGAPLTGPH